MKVVIGSSVQTKYDLKRLKKGSLNLNPELKLKSFLVLEVLEHLKN